MSQKLAPLPADQVQPTIQGLLAFLGDENISVPGNQVDTIVSAKSLCRAILGGQLVLCAAQQEAPAPAAPAEESNKPPVEPKKKVAKKASSRKKPAK